MTCGGKEPHPKVERAVSTPSVTRLLALGMLSLVTPPDLLPKGVVAVAAVWSGPIDPTRDVRLANIPLPERLHRAPARRRVEFLVGRWCARWALRRAGYLTHWTGEMGVEGPPLWPEGFTGTLTHTEGFAWAAVAPSASWAAIGIDAEQIPSVETAAAIARWVLRCERANGPGEESLRPSGLSAPVWSALAFSAKETLYKCLQPLTRERPRFRDARMVACEQASRIIRLRLEPAVCPSLPSLREFAIRWQVSDDRVYTALAIPSDSVRTA